MSAGRRATNRTQRSPRWYGSLRTLVLVSVLAVPVTRSYAVEPRTETPRDTPPAMTTDSTTSRPALARPSAAPPRASRSTTWRIPWPSMIAIGAACGLLCAGLLTRARTNSRRFGSTTPLEVVGRTALGPRHAMYVVRVGNRVLLIGAGNQGPPALLTELEHDDLPRPQNDARPITPVRFSQRIGAVLLLIGLLGCPALAHAQEPAPEHTPTAAPTVRMNEALAVDAEPSHADDSPGIGPSTLPVPAEALTRTAWSVGLFALFSLLPVGLLMLTAFVRISVVLLLARQAIGSPQIPGNSVMTALALLLTALVMAPVGESVYRKAVEPLVTGRSTPEAAWHAGSAPIKAFMVDQIVRSKHQDYLWQLYDHAVPPSSGRIEPSEVDQFPLRVVAPAFLLSELTTAFFMGFGIYLPFLVIDLVVATVLSAMGLFMLPPALVGLPLKLVLFVVADGWMLVADTLLRSFGGAA